MKLDQHLIDAVKTFIQKRFPTDPFAGAAAMYTACGDILISTAPDAVNASVELCHETGAICEAFKVDKKITASVCVSRDHGVYHILTPCGVCQERLMVWGDEVEVAVPMENDSTAWQSKQLKEVQPYYWRKPFIK